MSNPIKESQRFEQHHLTGERDTDDITKMYLSRLMIDLWNKVGLEFLEGGEALVLVKDFHRKHYLGGVEYKRRLTLLVADEFTLQVKYQQYKLREEYADREAEHDGWVSGWDNLTTPQE